MSKSIQLKTKSNEKMYPHPYYPVGSIYLSVVNTNPSTWFGGTWVQIAQGRTLVGVDTNDTDFNTVQKTGGEKTHTLNVNEMPNHSHDFYTYSAGNYYEMLAITTDGGWAFPSGASGYAFAGRYMNIGDKGGSQAHNNLQPYFTCYIWCRTA